MQAAVVVFPGSNADAEMVHTLKNVVGFATHIAWHKDTALPAGTELVAIPGGFSFGDYLRAGAIAKASPIVGAIRRHVDAGGLVVGICNGFQILCELGVLPGALLENSQLRFECRDVFVRSEIDGPFTSRGEVLRIPIAHREGRFHASRTDLDQLKQRNTIAFRYCDESGEPTDSSNPNGSLDSIAGICGGPKLNVLGMMPHPERASEPFVGSQDGARLFRRVAGVAN